MNTPRHHQTGAALIISMILLLVMTLIGVTAMQSTVLEEKMAGNYRDQNLAFQAAEAALREAESVIANGGVTGLTNFDADCTSGSGLCDATGGLSDVWKDATKFAHRAVAVTSLAEVVQQPIYWIEGYKVLPAGSSSWKYQYRITAMGYGGGVNTRVILQTVYRLK